MKALYSPPRLALDALPSIRRAVSQVVNGLPDDVRLTATRSMIHAVRSGRVSTAQVRTALRTGDEGVVRLMHAATTAPAVPEISIEAAAVLEVRRPLSPRVVTGLCRWLQAFMAAGQISKDEAGQIASSRDPILLYSAVFGAWGRYSHQVMDASGISAGRDVEPTYCVAPAPLLRAMDELHGNQYSVDSWFEEPIGDGVAASLANNPFAAMKISPQTKPTMYAAVTGAWNHIVTSLAAPFVLDIDSTLEYHMGGLIEGFEDCARRVGWDGDQPIIAAESRAELDEWLQDVDDDLVAEMCCYIRARDAIERLPVEHPTVAALCASQEDGRDHRLLRKLIALSETVTANKSRLRKPATFVWANGRFFPSAAFPNETPIDHWMDEHLEDHEGEPNGIYAEPAGADSSDLLELARDLIIGASAACAATSLMSDHYHAKA
jgi:hypothetical protein